MRRRTSGAKGRLLAILLSGLSVAVAACTEPPPDVPPRQISESTFHYPEELWDAGIEGETLLEIHVSRLGTVDSARIERSSGHAEFDSAALAGAQLLRFEPARRGDDSVAVRVHLPVQFQIPEESRQSRSANSTNGAAPADTLAPQ